MNKAVIMAGGFGTRLRPLTMNIPKPMVPISNSPMMEHIVNLLKYHSITEIVSVLYFQPDSITTYFENGKKFGVDMKYVMAQADYGTAGAVKNAYESISGERFIVISGDVLTDFDLNAALQYHIEKKSKATILLTRVKNPLQYGIVMTNESGKITRFLEKPSWGQVFSDTINTGIYILEPEVLDLIPYQEEFDFSKDLFPLMLKKKMPLYGYIAEGYWRDVGNLEEYRKGQLDAIQGSIKLNMRGVKNDNLVFGANCKIAPSAKFSGTVLIGDNCEIGEHAELADTVIGDHSKIGAGAKLRNVTLWKKVKVGDFAELNDDVICSNCKIGEFATVGESVFISDSCKIGKKSFLMPNIKLWPNKDVEDGATLTASLVQEEKWARELFTDARISGISNLEIHPDFGAKLGAALGMAFGPNTTMLASRDSDLVSRIMKRSITSGLASVGVKVSDLQYTSVPQTRQEMRTGKYVAGLHVRKNPRNKNNTDIIIFNKEGRDITIAQTKSIERYFFGEDIKRALLNSVGTINYPERTNEIYMSRFLESLDIDVIKSKKFKALMDYSYGLASNIFPSLLGNLGVEAISLHGYVDPSRYQGDPTMIAPEKDEMPTIMKAMGYELGFMIEAGAEKISVIDERGAWYSPIRLLTMVTKLFLETNKDREPYKIAVSIAASGEIEKMAAEHQVEVVRIQNSHSAMMEATRDKDVLFVGGVWGSFIFREFLFAADGMYSVGKILEMLARTNQKLSELDEKIPRRYQHQLTADCSWEYKGKVMRKLMEQSEQHKRELVEGVKMFFDNGDSVLVMPDKENPGFVVHAESEHYDSAVTLAKKYHSSVLQWKDED
jgi:mannose-1-phosphate guanylyltransferase/phosphomannomutase